MEHNIWQTEEKSYNWEKINTKNLIYRIYDWSDLFITFTSPNIFSKSWETVSKPRW